MINRFTDRTNCTDRNFNSRTVTVRVYWTTLFGRATIAANFDKMVLLFMIYKKNLWGRNKLVLPVAKTTTYGLKSTCSIAAKARNALPDNLRSVAEFAHFRNELQKLRNL